MKPAKGNRLTNSDMQWLFPFFDRPQVDYPVLKKALADRFGDNAILSTLCHSFVINVESIEAGYGAVMTMQPMIAKSVLSLLITLGRVKAAKIFLLAAVEKWDQERFREAHSMLMLSGDDVDVLDVLDRPWLDYQIYDRGHKTTMLLFCGLADRFGVEINAVALWLRSLPVNLVYIRDTYRKLYLGGIRSLGDLDETIVAMKKDLAALGTERSIVMGNSGGVYGCLYYADLLNASGVLCFAGPTSLRAGVQEASERPVYERIQRLVDDGELREPDLPELYRHNNIPVRYFYAENYAFDAAQAQLIQGTANISIEPLRDYSRHVVIGEMARRNQLKAVLADATDTTLDGLNREGKLVT
jgi:hypothetical protein